MVFESDSPFPFVTTRVTCEALFGLQFLTVSPVALGAPDVSVSRYHSSVRASPSGSLDGEASRSTLLPFADGIVKSAEAAGSVR